MHISKVAAAADLAYVNESVTSDDGLNSALFTYYQDDLKTRYVIAFRGTDTLDDWVMNNLILVKKKVTDPYSGHPKTGKKFLLAPTPYAHYGFYFAYLSVRKDVLDHIEDKDDIIFTGHSMGGALAALCALDMKYRFPEKKIKLVTFGAPRLGNYALAEKFRKALGKENCVRVVKLFDPVPHTPVVGYAHFPAQVIRMHGWNILHAHHMPDYYTKSKSIKYDV